MPLGRKSQHWTLDPGQFSTPINTAKVRLAPQAHSAGPFFLAAGGQDIASWRDFASPLHLTSNTRGGQSREGPCIRSQRCPAAFSFVRRVSGAFYCYRHEQQKATR